MATDSDSKFGTPHFFGTAPASQLLHGSSRTHPTGDRFAFENLIFVFEPNATCPQSAK
jgi:hypothetical protein